MEAVWSGRTDRFSADRLNAIQSPAGYDPGQHDKIEMITLGG